MFRRVGFGMGFVLLALAGVSATSVGCTAQTSGPAAPAECGGADLTSDGENCGICGRSCGGGACSAGVCQEATFLAGQAGPTAVTATDDAVYVTIEGTLNTKTGERDGRILRCPIDGCGEAGPEVVAKGIRAPSSPIVTADAIYVMSAGMVSAGGKILSYVPFRYTLDGVDKNLMVWPTVASTTAIAVDGTRFFATTEESRSGSNDAAVFDCPVEGCPENGTKVSWRTTTLAGTSALALDAGYAYFTEVRTGTIARVKRTGIAVEKLFTTEIAVRVLAVDDTSVYWGTSLPASGSKNVTVQNYVARGPKAGGTREKLAPTDELTSLALDATDVYFAEATGRIARVPKAGGDVVTLATAQLEPTSLFVRGDWIYWVTQTDGVVHRLRK
jgi:hypothetical protein